MQRLNVDKYPVIPKPVSLQQGDGAFKITPSTHIIVQPESFLVGEYLQGLIPFKVPLVNTGSQNASPGDISLIIGETDLKLGPEGYYLSVTPQTIVIRANNPVGLFYGVQSLRQVIDPLEGMIPSVEITDWPRFSWRGLMLDVGRHLFPVEFIKKILDVMALHKLNVFHWHLTEDQGWRIEIKKYPQLTKIGSKRTSSPVPSYRDTLDGKPYKGFYSQKQIKEIVAYAAKRYITVVPEIEMPGHSVAALASYPELGCTGGPYSVRNKWGIAEDVYCAGNEKVFTFLKDVLDEVLALFPSTFIHIGGDECPKSRWKQCPRCQKTIRRHQLSNEHELQSYFIKRIDEYINSKNRRLIGWDEILEGGLAPNASVMSWRGVDGGLMAVSEGHDVVMTPTSHCYFDYYQSAEVDKEPPAIGGILPVETVYAFDPVPSECKIEDVNHILGAQGNLWTEYISTPDQAGFMLFPRATALAEVLWSTAEGRDFSSFKQRLQTFLPFLNKMGMNYRPV